MKKIFAWVLSVALLVGVVAEADTLLDSLTGAAAVSGTNEVACYQGANPLVKCTMAQILTYIQANVIVPVSSGISGLGSGVATALAITHDTSGGVCTVGGGGCTGGGSVSITAATPNIVATPSPLTGTGTIGTTVPHNAPADGGSHSYTFVAGDVTKEVDLVSTFTAAVVPQATGSFGSGASFRLCHAGAITSTSTTSTINGIAGATGLKTGAHACDDWSSDGTNWNVAVGVPIPGTQDGTTVLANDGSYVSPGAGGSGIGTKISTCTLASNTCSFTVGSHDYYALKCWGVTVSTTADLMLTVNSDTTAAHYKYAFVYNVAGNATPTGSVNASATNITLYAGMITTDELDFEVDFGSLASTALRKAFRFQIANTAASDLVNVFGSGSWLQSGTAGTTVQLTTSAGTLGSGAQKCTLYAYDS